MIQICNKSNRDTDWRASGGGLRCPTGAWRPLKAGKTTGYRGVKGPWQIEVRVGRKIVAKAVVQHRNDVLEIRAPRGVLKLVVQDKKAG